MFCDEKIIAVYLGQREDLDIAAGADCWLDAYHEIAFHTTEGYRLLLETDRFMISMGVEGVSITDKDIFQPHKNEWLEEYIHEPEDDFIVDFESTLLIGQRLISVEKNADFHVIRFDDFSLKLYPYKLGKMNKSLHNTSYWSYNNVLGLDRFLKAKCPICGGDGEILLDFVSDYVVRCKTCKKSTYAEIQVRDAIEDWNHGKVQCDLSDIIIE